jgi:hypothetical protein
MVYVAILEDVGRAIPLENHGLHENPHISAGK